MSFIKLARKRISVRGYKNRAVDEKDLLQVLEAGRIAPSAANRQPWHFIVLRDEAHRKELAEVYGKEWFWQAPVIIVVCIEPEKAWCRGDGKSFVDVDGAIAMDHMTLCATDLGLGTCWIGAFDPEKLHTILKLPASIEALAMTPLGHPDDKGREKKRKELDEILHQETW